MAFENRVLIHNKDDIEFVIEFSCLSRDTMSCICTVITRKATCTIKM